MADDAQFDPLAGIVTPQSLAMQRLMMQQEQMKQAATLSGRQYGASIAGMSLGNAMGAVAGQGNSPLDQLASQNAGTIAAGMQAGQPPAGGQGPEPGAGMNPLDQQAAQYDAVADLFQKQGNYENAMKYRDAANIRRKQSMDLTKGYADARQAEGKAADAQAHAKQVTQQMAHAFATQGSVVVGTADGTHQYASIPVFNQDGSPRSHAAVQQDIQDAIAKSKDDQAVVMSQDKWAMNQGGLTATRGDQKFDLAKMKIDAAKNPLDPGALEIAYQNWKTTNQLPAGYSSRSGAIQQQTWNYIAKRAQEEGNTAGASIASGMEFKARAAGIKDFYASNGKAKADIRAINTAVQHMGQLEPLADALQNKSFTPANAVKNWNATLMGKTAPTSYDAVRKFVIEEVAKAVFPGGGGEQERQSLLDDLKSDRGPEQLQDIITRFKGLLAGKTNSLRNDWDVSTQGQNGDFNKFLLPETKAALHLGAAAAAPSVPTASGPGGQKLYLVNGQWTPKAP